MATGTHFRNAFSVFKTPMTAFNDNNGVVFILILTRWRYHMLVQSV